MYTAIYSDPDLGNFQDDWIGSDTTLGVGYAWNSDNYDEGSNGYGSPPAVGFDSIQGPIVPSPGDSAKVSNEWLQDFKNLKMTSFLFHQNGPGVTEDPVAGLDHYNYARGLWKDGKCMTEGGMAGISRKTVRHTCSREILEPAMMTASTGLSAFQTAQGQTFTQQTGSLLWEWGRSRSSQAIFSRLLSDCSGHGAQTILIQFKSYSRTIPAG